MKFPKSLIKFNKTLNSKKLMQADLVGEDDDPNYRDKVAKCLDWRVQKMKRRQIIEDKQWQKVVNAEKNYIMYKKGYKNMLQDLQEAKKNLSKFKRGLSVFEDEKLRNQLVTTSAAPVLSDHRLRNNFQSVILAHSEKGPQTSINQNVSKISALDTASQQ